MKKYFSDIGGSGSYGTFTVGGICQKGDKERSIQKQKQFMWMKKLLLKKD